MALSLHRRWLRRAAQHRWRQRFLQGSWSMELVEDLARQVQQHPDAASLCLYLDVRHCVGGVDRPVLDLVRDLQLETDLRSDALVLRLASHAHALGESIDQLLPRYRVHRRHWPRTPPLRAAASLCGYPRLLAACEAAAREPQRLERSEKRLLPLAMALERRLLDWPVLLTDLLRRSDGAASDESHIAVVGNAPSLLDRHDGDRIDSADLIVRFNRPALTPALAAHCGTRTDVWVMNPSVGPESRPADTRAVVISGPPTVHSSFALLAGHRRRPCSAGRRAGWTVVARSGCRIQCPTECRAVDPGQPARDRHHPRLSQRTVSRLATMTLPTITTVIVSGHLPGMTGEPRRAGLPAMVFCSR